MPSYPTSSVFLDTVVALRSAGCVFAEDEAKLLIAEAHSPDQLTDMVERRCSGLPLEQILGWAEFCGLRIIVEPGVFVPRRRTEFLIEQALRFIEPGAVVVDLGSGTGALGVVMAAKIAGIELYAADIDSAAVRCAHRNLAVYGGRVYQGDLFDALPIKLKGRVDLLLANMPYVPTDAIRLLPSEAREHESRIALDGGEDGLDLQRRVAADAITWLAPGGQVLFEASERQAPECAAILTRHGIISKIVSSEEYDATVVIGTKPKA